jgi:hypothetical protein
MTRSILSKGVSLFNISPESKNKTRRRDDTVLGRIKEKVRKFVYQDDRDTVGKAAAAQPFVAACRSSDVTFFQYDPRIISDPFGCISTPSRARIYGSVQAIIHVHFIT